VSGGNARDRGGMAGSDGPRADAGVPARPQGPAQAEPIYGRMLSPRVALLSVPVQPGRVVGPGGRADGLAPHAELESSARAARQFAESPEGHLTDSGCCAACAAAFAASQFPSASRSDAASAVAQEARNTCYWVAYGAVEATGGLHESADSAGHQAVPAEGAEQARLLREVFGPFPFRAAPAVKPAWLAWQDGAVVKLSQGPTKTAACQRGRWNLVRLTLLADTLEDAGCADADLLGHLRGPGPHVRGCWAVDLILSKDR
jgi:hypothetical protein